MGSTSDNNKEVIPKKEKKKKMKFYIYQNRDSI